MDMDSIDLLMEMYIRVVLIVDKLRDKEYIQIQN